MKTTYLVQKGKQDYFLATKKAARDLANKLNAKIIKEPVCLVIYEKRIKERVYIDL